MISALLGFLFLFRVGLSGRDLEIFARVWIGILFFAVVRLMGASCCVWMGRNMRDYLNAKLFSMLDFGIWVETVLCPYS